MPLSIEVHPPFGLSGGNCIDRIMVMVFLPVIRADAGPANPGGCSAVMERTGGLSAFVCVAAHRCKPSSAPSFGILSKGQKDIWQDCVVVSERGGRFSRSQAALPIDRPEYFALLNEVAAHCGAVPNED